MKSWICAAVSAALLAACTSSKAGVASDKASHIYSSPNLPTFFVDSGAIFCVSVSASESLWEGEVTEIDKNGLSSAFVVSLRNEFNKLGLLREHSDPADGRRLLRSQFLANPDGAEPRCRSKSVVTIKLMYDLSENGRPFSVMQEIVRGDNHYNVSLYRDLDNEWKSGSLTRMENENPIRSAIANDMIMRSQKIVNDILRF